MGITLKELHIWSDKNNGWQSKKLKFGKKFTFVSGENTCGKTPLLKSIFFALGVPVTFRNDIVANCSGVKLSVILNNEPMIFTRYFEDSSTYIVENTRTSKMLTFKKEEEISNFIFQELGFPIVQLTSIQSKEVPLYISSISPLIWKEQLDGWSDIYAVKNRFIVDQRQEAMRFALGLPAKNPFGIKAAIKTEKKNVEMLNEEIYDRNEIIKELRSIFSGAEDTPIQEMETQRLNIRNRLLALENDFSTLSSVTKDFDSIINTKQSEVAKANHQINHSTARINSLRQLVTEVMAEAETLSLNVDAADRFRGLKENICLSEKCGMFIASKEAFGRSLLYLKDQMKDLETSIDQATKEKELLSLRVDSIKQEIALLNSKKSETLKKSGAENLSNTIQLLTKQLIDVETKIATSENIQKQRKRLENLFLKRDKSHTTIEDLEDSKTKKREEDVKLAHSELATETNTWLETLKTTGISGNVHFENGFKYMIGNEKYSALDGSARIRSVLAFHAALFRLSIEKKGNLPKFLVLDTPKQQELKTNDLKEYFIKLRELLNTYEDVQIVFSSSEFDFIKTKDDVVWEPDFDGDKHPMYLGVVS